MVQHSSIDHTGITGTGGSFGSNANQVSTANAAGASTLHSAADHVHRGVSSIAHASNTFYGPVIFTTEGDLGITSPSSGTLAFKATSAASGGGATSNLQSASYRRAPSTGNYTTTSSTFVDVDGTNTNLTITTGARRVLISCSCAVTNSTGTFSVYLDVDLDGTRLGNGDGGLMHIAIPTGTLAANGSFSYVTDALTAASHTFKLQWRVDGNTATMFNTGTDLATAVRFSVVELYA